MTHIDEHIETDAFDREYGLEDLLPPALAAELLAEVDGGRQAAILRTDKSVYFDPSGRAEGWAPATAQDPPWTASTDGRRMTLFPLVHELEPIGLVALDPGDTAAESPSPSLGPFLARVLNRIINLNYQLRMTAGLHGQVVTESYEALKRKAALLARSEEKYRRLAASLEAEVERQTRKIEADRLLILQQEKMAAIGQLAAGMAHEINNPVGFVISNLSTLRTNTRDLGSLIGAYDDLVFGLAAGASVADLRTRMADVQRFRDELDIDFVLEDTGSLIDESLDGAKRIQIIVQNLRDFTHPSIDHAEDADVNACLDTTLAMLSGHLSDDIEIQRQYGDIPHVNCRLREMNQVFFNILKNAFQAVGERGRITLRTAGDGDTVTVSIADTGAGIAREHLGSIFNPFFTTREVGAGIGLGLYQAYATVKRHQGTISVTSSPGQGSTFTLHLPVAAGKAAACNPDDAAGFGEP